MSEPSKALDVFGIKPVAEAVNTVTQGAVSGASAFLSRICLPAAEEFGLLLKDKVSHWRARNVVAVVQKAEAKMSPQQENLHAHPRLVAAAIENGSWAQDEALQDMWAGLLTSSCTEEGTDESNLIFVNLLSQLTASEVRILNYACETARKYCSTAGWIYADDLKADVDQLKKISGVTDVHRLDRELDHLDALDLLSGGFTPNSVKARITPRALGLQMYARCQGFGGSPLEFFKIQMRVSREEAAQLPISTLTPAAVAEVMYASGDSMVPGGWKELVGKKVQWTGTVFFVDDPFEDGASMDIDVGDILVEVSVDEEDFPQMEDAKKGKTVTVVGVIHMIEPDRGEITLHHIESIVFIEPKRA